MARLIVVGVSCLLLGALGGFVFAKMQSPTREELSSYFKGQDGLGGEPYCKSIEIDTFIANCTGTSYIPPIDENVAGEEK